MNLDSIISSAQDAMEQMRGSIFSLRSITVLISALLIAIIIGRIINFVIRKLIVHVGHKADIEQNIVKADKYRRTETIMVLSIALIKATLTVLAIYFWWLYLHPDQQPTAIIGASALFVVLASATLGPILRDLSAGSAMMAEQWYGVGDHVTFDPFMDLKGVVERVTLRSTKVRGLNGEIIWINNQHIQAVRIAPKGVRTIAVDVFVSDLARGKKLINRVSARLPMGKLMIASPLRIDDIEEISENMWRISAVAQTMPGREWLIEKFAIDMLKEADEKSKHENIIIHGPVTHYADPQVEKRFARAVRNEV